MSPYPTQVTQELIVETAWRLIEEDGSIENLPVSRLAKELGIKAPSLYRYFASKSELLQAVNTHTLSLLFDAMNVILEDHQQQSSLEQLIVVAKGFRQFGHQHPVVYTLAFSTIEAASSNEVASSEESIEDDNQQFADVLRLQTLVAEISGGTHSLTALRGLLAIMHGFVMLEINQQLRRGGDLDEGYEKSVRAYLRGWQHST